MNEYISYSITVNEMDEGSRLDKFISNNVDGFSRSRLQSIIKSGFLTSGKKIITDCSYNIKNGEEFHLTIPKARESTMVKANIPLNIVYEDDNLLVIDKPAGLTVHPGAGNTTHTMANALLNHCGDSLSGIGGVMRPGIVHRLDKDTSGLLVAAKNDIAHTNLATQLQERSLKRVYHAIVWGVPFPPIGKMIGNIGRSNRDRKKMTIMKTGGKYAATHYKVLEVFGDNIASLVECRLETGRTHQIRVHFLHKGFPVIGDQSYGKAINRKAARLMSEEAMTYINFFKRQALHSAYIAFANPETGNYLEFKNPIREDKNSTSSDIYKLLSYLKTIFV